MRSFAGGKTSPPPSPTRRGGELFMKYFVFFILFFLAVVLETSVVQLPLTLLVLLSCAVIFGSDLIFFLAFLLGFLIDGLLFRALGVTSLFFLLFVLLIFVYEKRFELKSIQFIILFSFLGSTLYLLMFGFSNFLLQLLESVLCGVLIFFMVSMVNYKRKKEIELPAMV